MHLSGLYPEFKNGEWGIALNLIQCQIESKQFKVLVRDFQCSSIILDTTLI